MKKFKVTIITTFEKEIEVEAANAKKAQEIAEKQVFDGDVDGTDTLNFNTEVVVDEDKLPTEDEIGRPGSIDSDKQFEDYICNYLESEYGAEVESFAYEFDMRRIYIYAIVWKED